MSNIAHSARLLAAALLLAGIGPALAAVPPEITAVSFASDRMTLTWSPDTSADSYVVYRGYAFELASDVFGTPLDAELTQPRTVDPVTPVAGRAFFYLVSGLNADGEGTLGAGRTSDGAPRPRPNSYPWPGFDVAGRWDGPRDWPVVPIHAVVLDNGEVLSWEGGSAPTTSYAWDPETDTFRTATVDTDLFCAGHALLGDGRVLAAGGTVPLFNGRQTTWTYDPESAQWTEAGTMSFARYYPSLVALGDGSVLAFSGNDENGDSGGRTDEVERYDPVSDTWTTYTPAANKSMILYPALHLLPGGRVFHSGPEPETSSFDPQEGVWSFVAQSNFGRRAGNQGEFNSVLVPPGLQRVVIFGGRLSGNAPATTSVESIDLSAADPEWTVITPMNFPRAHSNATILPDGKVLISGGGFDETTTTYPSEIFDPQTGTFTVAAQIRSFRLYHSSVVLLPDGRLLGGGSTTPERNPTVAFYSPPYLFKGPRPVITSASPTATYGGTVVIESPDAASIDRVVWLRPGAVTHSKNMGQRYVSLPFVVEGTTITAVAPLVRNVAPPGPYLMFIVTAAGVPSEAVFVRID